MSGKFHPFEIPINKKNYPKRKGNKARQCNKKIVSDLTRIHDSETMLNITYESIKSHKKILDKRIKENRPISYTSRLKFFQEIEKFDIEYEVFCMRVYNFRETLRNFVCEFLDIKSFGMKQFLSDSKIRDIGINQQIEKINKGKLKKIIETRNEITHRVDKDFGNPTGKKIDEKINQQKTRSERVTGAVIGLIKIKNNIAQKIIESK